MSATPTGGGFVAIAAGYHDGFALRSDGTIAAWGADSLGQVSNAPTGGGFIAVGAGGENGYALAGGAVPESRGADLLALAVAVFGLGEVLRFRAARP